MLHQRLSLSRAGTLLQQTQENVPPATESKVTTATTARTARREESSSATKIVAVIICWLVVLVVVSILLLHSLGKEKTSFKFSDTKNTISTLPSLAAFTDSKQQKISSSSVSSGSVTPNKMELPAILQKPNHLQQQQHLVARNQRRQQQQQLGCQCTLPVCQTPFYCHRGIIRVHKMGVLLLHELVSAALSSFHFPGPVEMAEIKGSLAPYFESLHGKQPHDYRHVLVTRNFYQALLSGYLYHKGHRECELDHWGQPSKRQRKEWLMQENWEERILHRKENDVYHHHENNIRRRQPSLVERPWPPGRGRSLCTYLSDESEHHGLQVYMEWATTMYFDPILAFAHYRRRAEQEDGMERTLFWCYEDLLRQDESVTVNRLSEWLFPAHHLNNTATATPIYLDLANRTPIEQRDQFHGHATTSDPEVRSRLLTIIQKMDQDIFNGTIGSSNRHVFGCGVEI